MVVQQRHEDVYELELSGQVMSETTDKSFKKNTSCMYRQLISDTAVYLLDLLGQTTWKPAY